MLGTVLLVLCFTYGICTAEKQTGHVEYTILFDAGSSGTRMEITNFLSSGPSLKPSDVVQLDADPHKVKPGLDDLHDDPSKDAFTGSRQEDHPKRQAFVHSNIFARDCWNETLARRSGRSSFE